MTHVLISGASVAGPALAYWLHRHGMRATVVERAPVVRPGGLAIDFRGSAMTVLDRMGILDEVRRHATDMGDATIVDAAGTPIATMPSAIFTGDLEVLKSDLTRILYDLTAPDTEYLFDDSITALTEEADGVLVEFERGPARRFDLVVGADGVHSKVRSLAFGPKENHVRSLGYFFASFTLPNYLNLRRSGLSHLAGDRSVNIFSRSDDREARTGFMFPIGDAVPTRDVEAQRRLLTEAYAHVGWEAPRILAELAGSPDFYFDEMSQVELDRWSAGRVTLIGDAGYCSSPMSGRGTSQALLGAYILAGELARSDYRTAFAAHERALRDYVATNQEMARQGFGLMMAEPTQEMFDAMAAASTDEDSHDNVPLDDYTDLTVS